MLGGLPLNAGKRLRQLETENPLLKHVVPEQTSDIQVLNAVC